jgi:putative salt-induced outer membrane protein YdiY
MLHRALVAGLATSILTGTAIAQTVSKPDGAWRGSIGLGLTNTTGNTKTTAFTGGADAVRQTGTDKLGFYLQSLYGKARVDGADKITGKVLRLGGRYDRDLTDRWFGFGGLDIEKDRLAEIRWRFVPQAGVGYHVIKTDPLRFDVFGGLAYNRTDRYAPFNDDSGLEALLGEESIHKLSDTTSFRQRLVVYPGLSSDRSGEYRVAFDAGLVTAIVGGWNLTLTLANRYDSNAPAGRKKNDTLIFTGLQYGWGPK